MNRVYHPRWKDERGALVKLYIVPPTRAWNRLPYLWVSAKFYDAWKELFWDLTWAEVCWLIANIMHVGQLITIQEFSTLKVHRVKETNDLVKQNEATFLTPIKYADASNQNGKIYKRAGIPRDGDKKLTVHHLVPRSRLDNNRVNYINLRIHNAIHDLIGNMTSGELIQLINFMQQDYQKSWALHEITSLKYDIKDATESLVVENGVEEYWRLPPYEEFKY